MAELPRLMLVGETALSGYDKPVSQNLEE